MTDTQHLLTPDFRALSARLGQDPLQVQGPGGNTSIKGDETMWIKASGTELANAERQDIFVEVDLAAAQAEAQGAGDGSCKTTVIDPSCALRPSIETTFHAALPGRMVVHTHSIATLVHVTSPQGRQAAADKLSGLPFVLVPYAKPGLPLTQNILSRMENETRIVLLENHGLIVLGDSVAEVSERLADVEARLEMNPAKTKTAVAGGQAPDGFAWAEESWIAHDAEALARIKMGSFYPDHVVFLGPGLPIGAVQDTSPAMVLPGQGVALKLEASASQRAMLTCLSDFLKRLPAAWIPDPIGRDAEAELLNWDAEKYRQALAART